MGVTIHFFCDPSFVSRYALRTLPQKKITVILLTEHKRKSRGLSTEDSKGQFDEFLKIPDLSYNYYLLI